MITPEVGVLVPRMDVDSRIGVSGGLIFGYQLTPAWQLQLGMRFQETASQSDRWGREFQAQHLVPFLRLQYQLETLLGPNASPRFRPFVTAGLLGVQSNVSGTRFTGVIDEATNYQGFDFGYGLGLGFVVYLNHRLDVRVAAEYNYTSGDRLDGHNWPGAANRFTDQFAAATIGINIKLGKASTRNLTWSHIPAKDELPPPPPRVDRRPTYFYDRDRDGVADSLDLDPNTPPDVRVTTQGVPMDTDYDGIPDFQDPCPVQPGVNGQGCPEVQMRVDTVRVEVPVSTKGWYIIAGSMTVRENAIRLLERLQAQGFVNARILVRESQQPGLNPITFYRIALQRFLTREEALRALIDLKPRLKKQDLWLIEEK